MKKPNITKPGKPSLSLKKPNPTTFRDSFRTRGFRAGGYSVFAMILVVAIAVAVNVLVQSLPSKWTKLDTTSSGLFTISDQTEELLAGLTEDVNIYWVVQSGQEDSTISNLLDRYESLSDHVKITQTDPDVSPAFVQNYISLDDLTNNSLIVESGERNTTVDYYDIYETDYSDYYTTGTYETNFNGESELTSAIDYVTNSDLPKMYLLTGHGESTLSTSFQSVVEKANIETEELTLLTAGSVPEDADCLFIYAPTSDISSDEKDMIQTYLAGGGNLMLITNATQDETEFTNLTALMDSYGTHLNSGIVVEGDQNNYVYGRPYYTLPNIESHTITSPLSEAGSYVLLPIAQGLTVDDELPDNISVDALLTTSDSAYSKVAGYSMETSEKEDGDIDGPFDLAVAITDSSDEDAESHIIWVTSSMLLDDSVNQTVSGGNEDFFLNSLGYLCEREETITIHAKSMSSEKLTVPSGAASLMTFVIVAVLPLGYLGFGIATWARRRRR